MERRRWAAVGVGAAVVGAGVAVDIGVNMVPVPAGGGLWAVALAAVAGAAFLVAVGVWQRRTSTDPAATIRAWAATVAAQLREDLETIGHPAAMPVRWRLVRQAWTDHWENAVGADVGETARPVLGDGRAAELATLFDTLRPGRLVILGPSGAGKSVLAAQLADGWLTAARDDERRPVPVVVPIGSWDPRVQDLPGWLADRLARDHDLLDRRSPDGRRLADVLVEDPHGILPILDGFDELAEPVRADAVAALNRERRRPLVVTGRTDEFADAVRAADDRVLQAAAVVELAPLSGDELAEYLRRSTRRTAEDGGPLWDAVGTALRADDGGLRRVLANPLMAFLARAAYLDRPGRDPGELLRDGPGEPGADPEGHLLGQFLPAVYGDTAAGRRAVTRLTRLARHLDRAGTRDLAWWQLTDLVSDGAQVLVAAGFVVVTTIVGAIVGGILRDHTLATAGSSALFGVGVGSLVGAAMGTITQRFRPGLLRYRLRVGPEQVRSALPCLLIGLLIWQVGAAYRVPHIGWGALVATAAGVIGSAFVVADPAEAAPNPVRLLARSRTTAFVNLLVAAAAGVIGSRLMRLTGVGTFAWGLPFVLMSTLWGRWLLFVRVWLPLRGALPWRVHGFLADARRRGVLRQSGAVYRFRHARLQDRLAGDPTAAHPHVAAVVRRFAEISTARGSTTLAALARDLNVPVDLARTVLGHLVTSGAAQAWRDRPPAGRQPVVPAELAEHARFMIRLR